MYLSRWPSASIPDCQGTHSSSSDTQTACINQQLHLHGPYIRLSLSLVKRCACPGGPFIIPAQLLEASLGSRCIRPELSQTSQVHPIPERGGHPGSLWFWKMAWMFPHSCYDVSVTSQMMPLGQGNAMVTPSNLIKFIFNQSC